MTGNGCKKCKASFREKQIIRFFEEHNVSFIHQKTFDNCRGIKNKLPFDFYLPVYKICIEYDGEQHFNIVKNWGGQSLIDKYKVTDKIKTEYCKNNNIRLIRIKYDEDLLHKLNELYVTLNTSSNIFI